MRYLRNDTRDQFYDKVKAPFNRIIKVPKFTKLPSDHISEIKEVPGIPKVAFLVQPCFWCKTQRSPDEFIKVKHKDNFSIHWEASNRVVEPMETNNICIHCLCKLFDEWKARYSFPNTDILYMICAFSNIYYDEELAKDVDADPDARYYDDAPLTKDVHYVDRYMRKIEERQDGPTTFWNQTCSPFFIKKQLATLKKEDPTENMSEEDRDNYNIIWTTYHYDPFETDNEKDRPRLRANLVTMIDDAMKDDLVRMNAALEIVRAYYRTEKIGETLNQLQSTKDDIANNATTINKLTETKNKETAMVTQFSKDHGFASKYATAKSKGSGTLSAVIRDMKDAHYDMGIVNAYDIETAAAIKQVSDISAESIFKQVGLAAADYADMVREQAETIKKLTAQLKTKEEELRLFKEKEVKQELLEELRDQLIAKGIPTDNVDDMLKKEYLKNRVVPPL